MRVCPVGFALESVEAVLAEAKRSAEVTHNHPEGIKGAQATALAVFMAHRGETKAFIKNQIVERFGYDLSQPLETIRKTYRFDVSC
jgi:ADP-ribosylglycohydrolase